MRMATCICGEHGSVNVSGEGYGRTFTRGATVDLDETVAPDVETTWGAAIGQAYAHLFEPVDADPGPAMWRRERPPDGVDAASRGTRTDESPVRE